MYKDYYNNYNQNYKPKQEPKVFLFLVVNGNMFDLQALSITGHDLYSVFEPFKNMFPHSQPVGVFQVTRLEAYLLRRNFLTHGLTLENFIEYWRNTPINFIATANVEGYTSVYIDTDEMTGAIVPSLNRTSQFLGMVVNQKYYSILKLMFNERRINTTIIAASSAIE